MEVQGKILVGQRESRSLGERTVTQWDEDERRKKILEATCQSAYLLVVTTATFPGRTGRLLGNAP